MPASEALAAATEKLNQATEKRTVLAARAAAQGATIEDAFGDKGVPPAERGARAQLGHLPKGLSVMVLEPYPWKATPNPRVQVAGAEHLIWYPLLLLASLGACIGWAHPRVLGFPLVFAGGMAFTYALSEGDFGTAYRHRGELVWAVAVLAAAGAGWFAARRATWQRRSSDGGGADPKAGRTPGAAPLAR